jgi:hypothetical protein
MNAAAVISDAARKTGHRPGACTGAVTTRFWTFRGGRHHHQSSSSVPVSRHPGGADRGDRRTEFLLESEPPCGNAYRRP